MGWAGAAWAAARLRPFCHVSFLPRLEGPGAGPQKAYANMINPITSVEENVGRLIGHDREAQLAIGRGARRIARLDWGSKDFHYFAGSCFTNAREGGVQIGDNLGIAPRRMGPQARPHAPITALFSVASRTIR